MQLKAFNVGDVIASKNPLRGETAYLVRRVLDAGFYPQTFIYPFRYGKWAKEQGYILYRGHVKMFEKVGHIDIDCLTVDTHDCVDYDKRRFA